jgi:hypothetical protein
MPEVEAKPITIAELADHRLGREATTGEDYEQAKLPLMGGCCMCGATVAAYNSCPSKSGYLKCRTDCIGDDGYLTVEEACEALFPED